MKIEILYFDGCPNHSATEQMVTRVASELGVDAQIVLTKIPDASTAVERRFLGSPSVLVEDLDIEPGAQSRDGFGLTCRIFQTDRGLTGVPDEQWLRDAITRESK